MSESTNPSFPSLSGRRLLVVGGTSGIGARIAEDARADGADVITTSRHAGSADHVLDLGDESSIAAAAAAIGPVDHVVVLAANHANGPLADLDADRVRAAFDAKVVGPIVLAKHLQISDGGSMLLFSGVAAHRPSPGLTVMATTNGAVETLASALAVELAPIRVNAISPGIVDSGAWDGMDDKASFLEQTAQTNPARRVGTTADLSAAARSMLTNAFVTGTTLDVDGGGRLA